MSNADRLRELEARAKELQATESELQELREERAESIKASRDAARSRLKGWFAHERLRLVQEFEKLKAEQVELQRLVRESFHVDRDSAHRIEQNAPVLDQIAGEIRELDRKMQLPDEQLDQIVQERQARWAEEHPASPPASAVVVAPAATAKGRAKRTKVAATKTKGRAYSRKTVAKRGKR